MNCSVDPKITFPCTINILLKVFVLFNALNLSNIYFILCHSESSLHFILLRYKPFNHPLHDLASPPFNDRFHLKLIRLIHLLRLCICHYVFEVLVQLGAHDLVEDICHIFRIMIHHKELSLVILRSPFEENWEISSDWFKVFEADQGHIKAQLRA